MDKRIIRAARNALGYEVEEEQVAEAIDAHEGKDTRTLRKELREATARFEEAGGRGAELADEIDSMRIALAARSVGPRRQAGRG